MKALVYHGPGSKTWEDVPDAAIQEPTDVVVRVDTTTICGTDLHILQGDVAGGHRRPDPRARGGRHGRLRSATPSGQFAVGDRVLVPAITQCGRCEYCHARHALALPDGRRDRLDLRPPDRRHAGRVGPGALRGHVAVRRARGRHQRAGDLPGRLAAHRVRGRGAGRPGAAGRHGGGGRRGRGRPVGDPDHRAVGRGEGRSRSTRTSSAWRRPCEFGATDAVEAGPESVADVRRSPTASASTSRSRRSATRRRCSRRRRLVRPGGTHRQHRRARRAGRAADARDCGSRTSP